MFFLCSLRCRTWVEKEPRGRQINQVTGGNSTGRPETGPWSSSYSSSPSTSHKTCCTHLSYHHMFFSCFVFSSSFPPNIDPNTSFHLQTILSSSSSSTSVSKWDRFFELWGHPSPATIRHLLASTVQNWGPCLDTVQGERVIVREDVGEGELERAGMWENERTVQGRRAVGE